MLVAGFIAAIAILCSQPLASSRVTAKASTEQADDSSAETFIQAPSDAIPGHSVQVDDSSASHVITTFLEIEETPVLPPIGAQQLGRFLKVLLSTVISPNAP